MFVSAQSSYSLASLTYVPKDLEVTKARLRFSECLLDASHSLDLPFTAPDIMERDTRKSGKRTDEEALIRSEVATERLTGEAKACPLPQWTPSTATDGQEPGHDELESQPETEEASDSLSEHLNKIPFSQQMEGIFALAVSHDEDSGA